MVVKVAVPDVVVDVIGTATVVLVAGIVVVSSITVIHMRTDAKYIN